MFSINLVFVDAKTIRKLNRDYRGLDKATTVLSFCYCAPTEVPPTARAKGCKKSRHLKFPEVKDTINCLGEIFICQPLAKKQGLKVEELIIHGYKSILSQIPSAKNL